METAAKFVDSSSGNYAHWLAEVLPRVAKFCSVAEYEAVPIVICDGLNPNFLEALFIIIGPNRDVVALPPRRSINVESLVIVSAVGYVPFNTWVRSSATGPFGMFSPDAIQAIRKQMFTKERPLVSQRFTMKAR
jgi:hypothetical protein